MNVKKEISRRLTGDWDFDNRGISSNRINDLLLNNWDDVRVSSSGGAGGGVSVGGISFGFASLSGGGVSGSGAITSGVGVGGGVPGTQTQRIWTSSRNIHYESARSRMSRSRSSVAAISGVPLNPGDAAFQFTG